jgi:putative Mg2+ transporter-C (MgtC) family protein
LPITSGYIQANDWLNLSFRVGLSILLGGVIGLERQWTGANRSAGVRTHMIVSLGATLFILLPLQIPADYSSANALSRTIQGIATGLILQQSHLGRVKGLTSATAIWATAALGTAVGCGFWQMASVGTMGMLVVLSGVKQVNKPIRLRFNPNFRNPNSHSQRSLDSTSADDLEPQDLGSSSVIALPYKTEI